MATAWTPTLPEQPRRQVSLADSRRTRSSNNIWGGVAGGIRKWMAFRSTSICALQPGDESQARGAGTRALHGDAEADLVPDLLAALGGHAVREGDRGAALSDGVGGDLHAVE